MVVAGFMRYGEMEKVGDTEVAFSCGWQHDELMRLLLPYSRNISAVESMLRGQMRRYEAFIYHDHEMDARASRDSLTAVLAQSWRSLTNNCSAGTSS